MDQKKNIRVYREVTLPIEQMKNYCNIIIGSPGIIFIWRQNSLSIR